MTLATAGLSDPQGLADLDTIPRATIDEYLGLWACEPERLRHAATVMQGIDLVTHVRCVQEVKAATGGDRRESRDRLYGLTNRGVAMIQLRGTLMKFTSSLTGGASTVFARRALRQAVQDPEVRSILLVIDSPGGTVSGTMDLAEDVRSAATKKPVHAFVDDLTASAAYWVASQATRVYANSPTALIGSIGTFAVLTDQSKRAEQLGVKVHVIKAGDYKGTGTPGTAITDKQLEHLQYLVNAANAEFLRGVMNGRKMGSLAIQAVADGRVHPAREAKRLGLIDDVKPFDDVVRDLGNGKK